MHMNKNNKTYLVLFIVGLTLGSCATTVKKELVATGGSRADGTVQLSFEHGSLEKPQLDEAQGLETARVRCRAWGYSDAQTFGGMARNCQLANQYGCTRWYVTINYQCLGKPKT